MNLVTFSTPGLDTFIDPLEMLRMLSSPNYESIKDAFVTKYAGIVEHILIPIIKDAKDNLGYIIIPEDFKIKGSMTLLKSMSLSGFSLTQHNVICVIRPSGNTGFMRIFDFFTRSKRTVLTMRTTSVNRDFVGWKVVSSDKGYIEDVAIRRLKKAIYAAFKQRYSIDLAKNT